MVRKQNPPVTPRKRGVVFIARLLDCFFPLIASQSLSTQRLYFDSPGGSPMTRLICLLTALSCLVVLPGCSSCFGNSCRRPSFLEFRNTSRGLYRNNCNAPCNAPCEPCGTAPCGCEPCGSPTPCCEGGVESGTVIGPTPVMSDPGTFS